MSTGKDRTAASGESRTAPSSSAYAELDVGVAAYATRDFFDPNKIHSEIYFDTDFTESISEAQLEAFKRTANTVLESVDCTTGKTMLDAELPRPNVPLITDGFRTNLTRAVVERLNETQNLVTMDNTTFDARFRTIRGPEREKASKAYGERVLYTYGPP